MDRYYGLPVDPGVVAPEDVAPGLFVAPAGEPVEEAPEGAGFDVSGAGVGLGGVPPIPGAALPPTGTL
ncbi:MAG TPA: hypothetical protein VKU00_24350, partial [Chthonomonadaceae bacterium]|nr:hypothetical protein [Chthonomonadaceae bacterium]